MIPQFSRRHIQVFEEQGRFLVSDSSFTTDVKYHYMLALILEEKGIKRLIPKSYRNYFGKLLVPYLPNNNILSPLILSIDFQCNMSKSKSIRNCLECYF